MNRKVLFATLIVYSVIITLFLVLQIKQDCELQNEHHDLKRLLEDFYYNDSIKYENYLLHNYVGIIDRFYLIGKSKKEIKNIFSVDSICYLQEINNDNNVFEFIASKQYSKVFSLNYNSVMQLQGFNCYFLFYNDTLCRRIDGSGIDYSIQIESYIENHEIFIDD